MGVNDEDGPGLHLLPLALPQRILVPIHDAGPEARLGVRVGALNLHARHVAEVELEAAVERAADEEGVPGVRQRPCQDAVRRGAGADNLDVGCLDGPVGAEEVVHVVGEEAREVGPAAGRAGVGPVFCFHADLGETRRERVESCWLGAHLFFHLLS